MKKSIIYTLAFLFICLQEVGNARADSCPVIDAPNKKITRKVAIKAISLKSLQSTLKGCHSSQTCQETVYKMFGLTKLLGFVLDPKNNDLLIYGMTELNKPPLRLEDFVVTLRNSHLKYAKRRGNTLYYSAPGVSIDPKPGVNLALNNIKQELSSVTMAQRKRVLTRYRKICEQQQSTRVLGIPFDTHASQLMLKADYIMKTITNGSRNLDIPGLKGIPDMRYDYIMQQVRRGRRVRIPASSQDRYWFYPASHKYQVNKKKTNYFVSQSAVKLLTANQMMNSRGTLKDSSRKSPFAAQFALCFTRRYKQIAKKLPVYQELAGLFRQTAVTKLIKTVQGIKRSSLDAQYLLEEMQIKPVIVKRGVPGICRIQRYSLRNKQRRLIGHITSQSCGGVSIAMSENKKDIKVAKTQLLTNAEKRILKDRPALSSLMWQTKVVLSMPVSNL
ncbi:hypothetical protein MNBD_GAMMA12-2575 [hydrothermal vent metagenome]|uniref:Uncharacterized protein n=1 Tax=hydrothermal vent metagenome TaxID=652676 RepID=A0A3B0YML9_9ZZZZ